MVWMGEMRLREELRVTPRCFSLKKMGGGWCHTCRLKRQGEVRQLQDGDWRTGVLLATYVQKSPDSHMSLDM